MSSLESFVALRYLRPRRGQFFVSLVSFASTAGIALCVAALITVVAVMNGFGNELRTRLVSLTSHVTIATGEQALTDWQPLAAQLASREGVAGVAPFVEGQGMIVNGTSLNGTLISGVDPERERAASDLSASLIEGDIDALAAGGKRVLLGSYLAFTVGARTGDQVTLMIPRATRGGVLPQLRRFEVAGIFDAGVETAESARVVMHIDDAMALFGTQGSVSGLRVRLDDLFEARTFGPALGAELGPGLSVTDWTRQQESYFRALVIEKVMMMLFLLLAVAVAAFNINAMLMMVVSEKRKDIAVFRTLGLSPRRVTQIFLRQGAIIASVGVALGVVFGVSLALSIEWLAPLVEKLLGTELFPADVYYTTRIPAELDWREVAFIAGASLLLALSSTIYPARRAALIEPAEALRYD